MPFKLLLSVLSCLFYICSTCYAQGGVTPGPNAFSNIVHFDAIEYSTGNKLYIGNLGSGGGISWSAYPGNVSGEYRFRYSNGDAVQIVHEPWAFGVGDWSIKVSDNGPSQGGLVQWRRAINVDPNAKVGIDVQGKPQDRLHVSNGHMRVTDAAGNVGFRAMSTGRVGIGTANPQAELHLVDGRILITDGSGNHQFRIGSNGFLRARQIDVDLATITPDYVFEENYELMSIQELRAFLATHGHLPGIPSASEFEARGSINLAEMDFRLLEKVEEQALYILELESRINELESQVVSLQIHDQAEGTASPVTISHPQETRPENHDVGAEAESFTSLKQRLAEVERLLETLAPASTSK